MDTPLVFGLLAFIFFQLSNLTSREIRDIYNRGPNWIPSYVFGPVWLVMYLLVFFSGYFAFTTTQETPYYVAMVVLYIVNGFLNKWWTVIFFDNENVAGGLWIALFLVGTGATTAILMGLSDLWLSMGLYLGYVAWLIVALILNCQWWCSPTSPSADGVVGESILPTRMLPRKPLAAPRMPRRVQTGLVKHL